MSLRSQICVLAIAVGLAGLAVSRPATAAMQTPASLQALVGNWACTYTGPKGTTKSTYTITKSGDLWVQGSGHTSASPGRPANDSFFLIGYDPKKHVFVNMGGSTLPGEYGISTAPGAARAMTMTYANEYPADPTHEKDVWSYTSTGLTIASSWTEKGKTMTGKGTCTKS
jgi:hypothetical protein